MENFVIITAVLFLAFVLSELFQKFKYPRMMGQLLAGIILSIGFLKEMINSELGIIQILGDFGIVFLLLLVGLELNLSNLKKSSWEAVGIAFLGVLFPFSIGFFTLSFLGFDSTTSIFVGVILSISAPAVTVNILEDLNVVKTKIGEIIIGSAIVDDFIGILLLSVLVLFVGSGLTKELLQIPLEIGFFIVLFWIFSLFVPIIIKKIKRNMISEFSFTIIVGLLIAGLAEKFKLSIIIGAFVSGLLIQKAFKERMEEERKIVKYLKVISFGFLVPFFFISIGLLIDLRLVFSNLFLTLMLILIAVIGKILGAIIMHFFTKKINLKQSVLIGVGMNARGSIELVVATIALVNGFVSSGIYSSVVVMSIVTTLLVPVILKYMLKKYPKIMAA